VAPDLGIALCIQNSRFAGRAFSQFVEVQGGGLWRADFHLRRKLIPVANPMELRLEMAPHAAPPPPPADPQVDQYTLDIKFDTALATLRPDARGPLEELVASLRGSDIQSIRVVAHTDSVRIAPRYRHVFADNYKLSEGRAATVATYLAAELGLTAEQIFTSGWGPDEPVASNSTAEGRQKNRRTEVLVFKRNAVVESAPMAPRFDLRAEVLAKSAPVQNLTIMVELPPGLHFVPGTQRREGAVTDTTYEVNNLWNQVITFRVGALAKGGRQRIAFQAEADAKTTVMPASNAPPALAAQAVVRFDTENPAGGVVSLSQAMTTQCGATSAAVDSMQVRAEAMLRDARRIVSTHENDATAKRAAITDDATANGAGVNWFANSGTGIQWVFPPSDHNPRLPSVRVVLQHEPSQRLELFLDGHTVNGLHFEATRRSADSTRAVSIWSGIDLKSGANHFSADVFDRSGTRIRQLERLVYYSGGPVRAELAAPECRLIADGIEKPVIAVRFYDREGRPRTRCHRTLHFFVRRTKRRSATSSVAARTRRNRPLHADGRVEVMMASPTSNLHRPPSRETRCWNSRSDQRPSSRIARLARGAAARVVAGGFRGWNRGLQRAFG
jgi:outer membrane protein OmpA-like peptidoglycan-associated protein